MSNIYALMTVTNRNRQQTGPIYNMTLEF